MSIRHLLMPILGMIVGIYVLTMAVVSTANPPATSGGQTPCWQVDEVRAGMKGIGRTVMKGTKIEEFNAEILGVMRNTSPGRDMILARLSGLGLEKSGVIAGMSGSPVYVDGKLLGAVAYAWAYGKEPIAGITPFVQMRQFAEGADERAAAEKAGPVKLGRLPTGAALPVNADGEAALVPLRTPLAGTGFTAHSLRLLGERLADTGLVPMSGGGVGKVDDEDKNVPLQPGGPLAVALVTGDFDLSGIGTVTHVEGDRVWGWGHPFLGIGGCDFPMMSGFIHTVMPRQSVSFKLGSPLKPVGVLRADVSTCVAGYLGRESDMLPIKVRVRHDPAGTDSTFNLKIVRQKSLMGSLVYTVLTNCVDMEGDLPEELTAEMRMSIEIEGHAPIVWRDTFSGGAYAGGRAPMALYSQVAALVGSLVNNPIRPLRLKAIEAQTRVTPGRRSAWIESVELLTPIVAPGDTVKANVLIRPHQGELKKVPMSIKLPADLPEGGYNAGFCDGSTAARMELRAKPHLSEATKIEHFLESLRVQTAGKRTDLAIRVPLDSVGVSLEGQPLTDLPPSMVQLLSNNRRTGRQVINAALTATLPTDWVIYGSEVVRIQVKAGKRGG